MSRMKTFLCLAACALALAGCAVKEAKWSGETASMVTYAKKIPLYPGARARDAMGSESWGDTPDSYTKGMCVWFEVEHYDKNKVLAWYEEHLPGAQRNILDLGIIELKVIPEGAEPGEDMGVYIDDDGFRVFENVKPGKQKNS
jgi:hypothetical protein